MEYNMLIGMCWFFGSIVLISGLYGLFVGESQAHVNVLVGCILMAVGYFVNRWNTKTKI